MTTDVQEVFSSQIQDQVDQYLKHVLQVDYILEYSELPSIKRNSTQATGSIVAYRMALTEVLEPLQQLVFLPGKRWRPTLTLLHALLGRNVKGGEWLQSFESRKLLGPVVALVELLHNATLIADDIEDNGKLRRGIPALHLSYGLDRALNACNWAYFLPSTLLKPLERAGYRELALQLQGLSMQCLSQIHLGQALDIRWHRQHDYIPSVEEYFFMASSKTGALAGFAAEVGILLGRALWQKQGKESYEESYKAQYRNYSSWHYRELWQRIGRAFQVLDDLINITVGNPGKLRGDDWLEGKKSLPLCLFIQNGSLHGSNQRSCFIASLMQKAQQIVAKESQGEKADLEELAKSLEQILGEFLNFEGGQEALHDSVIWLERELAASRQIAGEFYGTSSALDYQNICGNELLAMLTRLDCETQRCRDFLEKY